MDKVVDLCDVHTEKGASHTQLLGHSLGRSMLHVAMVLEMHPHWSTSPQQNQVFVTGLLNRRSS